MDLVVSFALKDDFDLRPYEVNTQTIPSPGRKKAGGKASATLARTGSTATVNVVAQTAGGVTMTLAIDCQAVTSRK